MTGWTQFTARFEEEQHADALVEDAQASPHRVYYAKSYENIARIRLSGYNMKGAALDLLEAAGPLKLVMLAIFNDTSDSGHIEIYNPQMRTDLDQTVSGASCPEASRWDFRLEVGGLVETGLRAGEDFSLEEEYNDSS